MVSKGATKTSGRSANNSAVSGAMRAPSPCVALLSRTRLLCSTHPSSPSRDRNRSTFGFGPSVNPRSATRRMTSCPFAMASQAPSPVAADTLSRDRRFVTFALPRCLEGLADWGNQVYTARSRARAARTPVRVPEPPRLQLAEPCSPSSGLPADILKRAGRVHHLKSRRASASG
jgi:hypothetical protein